MTVAELIERLRAFPPDTPVIANDREAAMEIESAELHVAELVHHEREGYVSYWITDFAIDGKTKQVVVL